MNRARFGLAGISSVIVLFALTGGSEAFYVDNAKTLEVSSKAQTRASFRLDDSEGYTYPDTPTGNLVQHRNLLLLEVNHDLSDLMNTLYLLSPFKALDIRMKYHVVGRFLYEGIYDYGPDAFQEVREMDKENIDTFKQSNDLWECYIDLSRGPVFLRAGKQNLAWGETDMFRLLDYINPVDNTYGGVFEDLDDRRIPLWMLRSSYNLGTVGPVSMATLEAFWVPGFWDVHVSPLSPLGTPYTAPQPILPMEQRPMYPGKKMSNSRWGVRVSGLLGDNLNVSLVHFRTYLDMPVVRLGVTPGLPFLLSPSDAWQELIFDDVQITGASMNYFEQHTGIVFRGEVGMFWDEPVMIPDINLKLSDTSLPLPPALVDWLSEEMGIDLRSLGFDSLPLNPTGGSVPKKDILRFMVGMDKFLWIRPLNPRTTFMLSLQYFGQWVPDYDERMKMPLSIYPNPMDFVGVRETEHTFTGMINTNYLNGKVTPTVAMAYDVRGALLVAPSLAFIREPFRFTIQYNGVFGNLVNFGAFRDRDQVTFIFSYLLN